jgi:hypothetical protein
MMSCSARKGLGVLLSVIMVASLIYTIPLSAAISPEAQAYLARAMQTPLTFTVPKAQSDKVWSRITTFMVRYLNGGTLGKITDSVAATGSAHMNVSPGRETLGSEYVANRTVKGDAVEFSIGSDLFNTNKRLIQQHAYVWSEADLKIVQQNLHLWALYARTGEIRPELVDKAH